MDDGYAVDVARDGSDGWWRASTIDYDLVLLDIMLPGMDGVTLLRRMREKGRSAPVLLLTARDAIEDRITGLDAGADDYLVKPFAYGELLARIRALLRRGAPGSSAIYEFGELMLDPVRRRVSVDGSSVELTSTEFALLHLLIRNPERVFTRTEIEEHIYGDEREADTNVVDVFVSRLRKKLGGPTWSWPIRTMRGAGYSMGGSDE
jgi:two-component system OmpR family response regulator